MRFLKFLVALVLLPTVYFMFVQTGKILWTVFAHFQTTLTFLCGAGVYAVLHYTVYDFSRPYVFMHEFTHALFAFLCGARINSFSVKCESGYVKMDKTNMLIILAPYVVPGYTLLSVFVYMVFGLFADVTPYVQVFVFGVGFWMSFHFIQTCKTLLEADQPDLKLAGGKIFSIVMIVLVNLGVLACVLKWLFPEQISLVLAGEEVVKGTLNVGRIFVNYILEHIIAQL